MNRGTAIKSQPGKALFNLSLVNSAVKCQPAA